MNAVLGSSRHHAGWLPIPPVLRALGLSLGLATGPALAGEGGVKGAPQFDLISRYDALHSASEDHQRFWIVRAWFGGAVARMLATEEREGRAGCAFLSNQPDPRAVGRDQCGLDGAGLLLGGLHRPPSGDEGEGRERKAAYRDDQRNLGERYAPPPIVALCGLVLLVAGELVSRRGWPRHEDLLFYTGVAMSVIGGGAALAVAIWWGGLALVAAMPWLWGVMA